MTLTSDKSSQVETDVQVAKISIFHEMTLTLTNDLDTQTWPRYCQDVRPHQNEVSMSTGSKVIAQKDRHTHTHRRDENITSTAYAGGNN